MTARKGYLTVALGSALIYAGVFQMLGSLGTVQPVLLWAMVALSGVFIAIRGGVIVLTSERTETAKPENALRKTDSRFGR